MRLIPLKLATCLAVCFLILSPRTVYTAEQYKGPNAPTLSNFTITPKSVSDMPARIRMTFDYKNIKGALENAEVSMEYKGGNARWRKVSINQRRFQIRFGNRGTTEESGTFSTRVRFRAFDDPPFDVTYWLRIKDSEGRWSNEVKAVLSYE